MTCVQQLFVQINNCQLQERRNYQGYTVQPIMGQLTTCNGTA